jgi:four helix bundle protein
MTVKSHTELLAYQKAYRLVMDVYRLTAGFPPAEQFGLTSQMRRSAVSIPSNIAEGWARGTREYAHFLRIALGSAAELHTQLSISHDLGYCNKGQFENASALLEEVIKLLRSYLGKITTNHYEAREDPSIYTQDS